MNLKKCVWSQPQVTFLEQRLGRDKMHPDPAKDKAIVDMHIPANVKELQQIGKKINYI